MTSDQEHDVRAYYARADEREWLRLSDGEGLVEFAITTPPLSQHLPSTGRVLDIGGGPGRYAIWPAAANRHERLGKHICKMPNAAAADSTEPTTIPRRSPRK